MVLLPHSDEEEGVLGGGGQLSSASTELASEGTPAKVCIAAPSASSSSSATTTTTSTTTTTTTTSSSDDTTEPSTDDGTKPPNSSTTTTTTSTTLSSLVIEEETRGGAEAMGASGPLSPYRPSRVTLGSVNACITCNLCKGYLIDATTIVECLHSFCHSCIIKHLRTEQYCPQCEVMINKAKPNIKPDVPLQSIVFKLVPELYENELRRRRDFYRDHPDAASLATPAQRGEDTEHLIFSPNEQISLSLEYAESELAEDNKDLLRARYLLCPAVFSIAMMKKFIVNKYGISERQFCVEIMYKVKTIVLPDYYTLMDVAYIYTWKRDAPMKYFYRIRTTETNPLELPEIPLRRSPSLITAILTKQQQQQQQQQKLQQQRPLEDAEDDKENMHLAMPLRSLLPASANNVSENSTNSQQTEALGARPPTTASTTAAAIHGTSDVNGNRKLATDTQSPSTPTTVVARKNESIKLKIELNKNKYVSFLQSPQSDVPASQSASPLVSGAEAAAGSGGATGGETGAGTGFLSPASGGRVHKSDRPDKVKRKKTDSPRTQKIHEKMHEQMNELKIRIEKIKDHALTSVMKKKKLVPYKVELSPGISQSSSSSSSSSESKKLHKSSSSSSSSPALALTSASVGSSTNSLSFSKLKLKSLKGHNGSSSPPDAPKHPIVLKIDQRSPDMATSTLKFEMSTKESKRQPSKTPSPPPFPPSPPSPPVKRFEDEKSQFLNSFQLAPTKTTPAPPTGASTASPTGASTATPTGASTATPTGAPTATPTPTTVVPPSSPKAKDTPVTTSPTAATGTASAPSSPPSPPKSPGSEPKKPSTLPTLNGSPSTKPSSSPPRDGSAALKRKAKDSSSIRSGPKKQKLSDDEIKALVEKKVAENIKSPSEHIVPPIFLKPAPKVPSVTAAATKTPTVAVPHHTLSPPLVSKAKEAAKSPSNTTTGKSPKAIETARAKCDSPRPFLFKQMPPPPPPIVSVSNIPAVKPSQPVLQAPVPQKMVPGGPSSSQPSLLKPSPSGKTVPSAPGHHHGPSKVLNGSAKASLLAQAPARRPTVPTKLPTSNATNAGASNNATTHSVAASGGAGSGKFQKQLELKRAQSNPWVNITTSAAGGGASPMRDTEISKLRPEDIKKNVKVYGPSAGASTTAATAVSTSSSSAAPTSTTVPSMPKLDSGNFVVPKPKPASKPQPSVAPVSSAASSTVASSSTTTTSSSTPTKSIAASQAATAAAGAAGGKVRPVNYLNYAMFNSKAAPAGSRTPIPSYSSSPSYSPDSPQYNPNLNISTKQFKYANPTAFSNYMQNMMSDRKPGTTSPPTPPASSPSPPQPQEPNLPAKKTSSSPPATTVATTTTTSSSSATAATSTPASDRKRPASAISPDTTTKASLEQPPEKQPKVQSLLNQINIPASLSITLATEEDEVARQTARKLSENDPTNNYIEIVKLPEIPLSEASSTSCCSERRSPPVTTTTASSRKAGSLSPPIVGVVSTPAMQVLPVTTTATTTAATVASSSPPSPSSSAATTSTASSPSAPAATSAETYQKKFIESINPASKSGGKGPATATKPPTTSKATTSTSAPATSSASVVSKSAGKPSPTTVAPARPSTPKVSPSAIAGAVVKYKNPNATVMENGKVKLHNYQDVDLLVKGFNSAGAAQRTSSSAKTMMPPPPAKGTVPIAPKTSPNGMMSSSGMPTGHHHHRKAISPPVMRNPSSSSSSSSSSSPSSPLILNGLPKSKTPPSILPSMASMGPMFGIQMKSDANASASGGTPMRRNSTTCVNGGSSYSTNPTLPRRKITPANNTTTLVPLRSSPNVASPVTPTASMAAAATSPKSMPQAVSIGDFITLHPQPSPLEQHQQQQQQLQHQQQQQQQQQFSQLHNFLALASQFQRHPTASIAAAAQTSLYPYLLQQFNHQQHQQLPQMQRNLVGGPVAIGGQMAMGADSLTITATPQQQLQQQQQQHLQQQHLQQQHLQQQHQQHRVSSKQPSSTPLNSLTVTAIRGPNGPASGKNGGGGGNGGVGGVGGGMGIGAAVAAAHSKSQHRAAGVPGKPHGGGS